MSDPNEEKCGNCGIVSANPWCCANGPHGLDAIRESITLMRRRQETGQGTIASAMCRLSLPMADELLAMAEPAPSGDAQALSNGLYYAIEIMDGEPLGIHAFATAEHRQWFHNGYAEAASGDGWLATYPLADDEWDSDQDELRAETERFMAAHMAEEGLTLADPDQLPEPGPLLDP